jgi:hypothetical protein
LISHVPGFVARIHPAEFKIHRRDSRKNEAIIPDSP